MQQEPSSLEKKQPAPFTKERFIRAKNAFISARKFVRSPTKENTAQFEALFDLIGLDTRGRQAFKEFALDVHASSQNETESAKTDAFLIGGILAFDLIVLQAVLAFNPVDLPSIIALCALGISIPIGAGYLCVRFIQKEHGIDGYGWKIMGKLPWGSMAAGGIGTDAAIWHVSWIAGLVFFITSLSSAGLCSLYYTSVVIAEQARKRYQQQHPEDKQEAEGGRDKDHQEDQTQQPLGH